MKHNLKILFMPVFGLLFGCSSPDTELMSTALQQSGLPIVQAECYADRLSQAVDAKSYNFLAEMIAAGESREKALVRARRKFGSDFRNDLKAGEGALEDCLR